MCRAGADVSASACAFSIKIRVVPASSDWTFSRYRCACLSSFFREDPAPHAGSPGLRWLGRPSVITQDVNALQTVALSDGQVCALQRQACLRPDLIKWRIQIELRRP